MEVLAGQILPASLDFRSAVDGYSLRRLGVAASVPSVSLTEDTGRGQSRWFRVEACLILWSTPHFWGRHEPEFGVPAQGEAERKIRIPRPLRQTNWS